MRYLMITSLLVLGFHTSRAQKSPLSSFSEILTRALSEQDSTLYGQLILPKDAMLTLALQAAPPMSADSVAMMDSL